MKFAVQLNGQASALEMIAPCFQGDSVRIVRRNDQWFLESSEFEQCANGGQVFPIADELLRLIHRVAYLYARLDFPFELGYVEPFNEDGAPLRRAMRANQAINVCSSAGIEELRNSKGSLTLGAETVGRAISDQRVREALALLGESDLGWPQLYDIVEFLGPRIIAKKKWATAKEVSRLTQTANHYRHLGRPNQNPLPRDSPSLNDSRSIILGFMKRWMAEQV